MDTSNKNQDEVKPIYIHLIWLDASEKDGSDASYKTKHKFNLNFGRCIWCSNTGDCEKAVNKSFEETQFVLVVSGQIGASFVPTIKENQKYSSIYVYCGDKTKHEKWANEYRKVKFVSNDLDELISKIRADHSS